MPDLATCADTAKPEPLAGPRSGADLACGAWGTAVVVRADKPPLRFKGRRLMLHWRDPSLGNRIVIELWQRQAGGFVVAHSLGGASEARTHAVRVKDLDEAMSYLEDLCAAMDDNFAASGKPAEIFIGLQQRLVFDQHFALLVGVALADWSVMPNLKERLQ